MRNYSSLNTQKNLEAIPSCDSDNDPDEIDAGLSNPKLINALKECTSRQEIDEAFHQYKVSDFQCRVQILREAMNCLMMLNASIENPRIKREKLSAEQRLKMMYEAEKTSFLDDLGFS